MPNRLGLLHVRPGSERQATEEEEVDKVVAKINDGTSSSSSSSWVDRQLVRMGYRFLVRDCKFL